jgi:hypothetical protein
MAQFSRGIWHYFQHQPGFETGSSITTPREASMQQIKLFKGIESEVTALEQEANAWIRETNAKVIHIRGNIAPQSGTREGTANTSYVPSDILLVITYEPADG